MKRFLLFFTSSVLVLLLVSSCVYIKYTKQANKYEAAGLYESALEQYIKALKKKPDYIDARIGLIRMSTRYSVQLSDQIEQAYAALDDDQVVSSYLKLRDLRNQVAPYDMELNIDSRIEGQFRESKMRFLSNKYRQAEALMDEEKFSEAAALFDQVVDVDPTYERAAELVKYCKCEPIYRQAVANMTNGKYRAAYLQLGRVLNIDSSFKDALDLRQEAINKGVLTVAFVDVRNAYGHRQLANMMVAEVKTLVQRHNDPFLRIVDLYQTEALIEEQKRALANNLDLKSAIIPVRAHLACRINDVNMQKSKFKEVKMKGFLREVKSDKSVVYHKIYYYDCEQTAQAWAQVSYDLTSTSTGLIILSGIASASANDAIHYIYYKNDSRDLNIRMGSWENENKPFDPAVDYVSDNFLSSSQISSLVQARRSLKAIEDLELDLSPTLGRTIAQKLINFNPEQ